MEYTRTSGLSRKAPEAIVFYADDTAYEKFPSSKTHATVVVLEFEAAAGSITRQCHAESCVILAPAAAPPGATDGGLSSGGHPVTSSGAWCVSEEGQSWRTPAVEARRRPGSGRRSRRSRRSSPSIPGTASVGPGGGLVLPLQRAVSCTWDGTPAPAV